MNTLEHFFEQEFTANDREHIAQAYENYRKEEIEKLRQEAIFPKETEIVRNIVREKFIDLLGTFPEDTPLFILNDRGNDPGGVYKQNLDVCVIYLTEDKRKSVDNGDLWTIIYNSAHEYAHALSYSEMQWKKASEKPKRADAIVSHFGFMSEFETNEQLITIGHFLEEITAQTVGRMVANSIFEDQNQNGKSLLVFTDREADIATEILDLLSTIADVSRMDLVKIMIKAKLNPIENEQSLRKLLEQHGNDGLYDLLLTLPVDQQDFDPTRIEGYMQNGLEKIKGYINEKKANSANTPDTPVREALTSLAPDGS